MSKRAIVFSPRAQQRMEEIADYLYQQNLSNEFVLDYLSRFETWLDMLLGQFPESGTPMPEYGDGMRRVVYHKYSFIYRVKEDVIEILTVYRDNLPRTPPRSSPKSGASAPPCAMMVSATAIIWSSSPT